MLQYSDIERLKGLFGLHYAYISLAINLHTGFVQNTAFAQQTCKFRVLG